MALLDSNIVEQLKGYFNRINENIELIAFLNDSEKSKELDSFLQEVDAISEKVNIPVIASGGAGAYEHFLDAFEKGKADAVLAASLFHFGEIPIPKLKEYLRENNISVRL